MTIPNSNKWTALIPRHHIAVTMPKIEHVSKLRVIQLYREGWRPYAIRRKLAEDREHVTKSSIQRIINDFKSGNFLFETTITVPQISFKTINNQDLKTIDAALSNDCNLSARELQSILAEQNGTHVSITTVRKAIDAAGWVATAPRYCQMIRDKNKEARLQFCKDLITTDDRFEDVIFSDETTLQLHDNKVGAYRRKESALPTNAKPKHPLKVHVWGAISKRGATQLVIFDGIMDAAFFVPEVLESTLKPFIDAVYPDGHRFQQDNDPKHTSNLAKNFMAENDINWWKWPAESPDLNPIEMVWNQLKRNVSKRNPTTKDQLTQYIEDFWLTEMTPELCSKYIDHTFKVAPVVVAVNGKATADIPRRLFTERSSGKSFTYFHEQLSAPQMRERLTVMMKDR